MQDAAEGNKTTEVFFLQGLRSEIRNEVLKFENLQGLKELKDMARKIEILSVKRPELSSTFVEPCHGPHLHLRFAGGIR